MEAILAALAGGVVAPVIKKILGDKIGGEGGELAGRVVDMIAEKAGVPVDKLDTAKDLPAAIEAVEPEALELLVESQRLMNETLQAEMDKGGPTWTWAWRPFGMWLFLGLVPYYAVAVPLLNVLMSAPLALMLDVTMFGTLFMFYAGFYMGGHTAKRGVDAFASIWRDKK